MTYHIDADKVTLEDLRQRIEGCDLVPSRVALLDGMGGKFAALEQHGVATCAALRTALKNPKRLEAFARETGIDAQYLTLLRREIESYFPKPFPWKDFDWLPQAAQAQLEAMGMRDTAALYHAAQQAGGAEELAASTGLDAGFLDMLVHLADLTRMQWVSPTGARMLLEAGYDSTASVAAADPEALCQALERANAGDRFFKGKIGLRDIKRLVRSAQFVPK